MKLTKLFFTSVVLTIILLLSCEQLQPVQQITKQKWDLNELQNRAESNLDSTKWNQSLFEQDIETYTKYTDIFETYPLSNHPFPVADYDYAVYSNPFTLNIDSFIFKGIQIGEYINPDGDSITTKLTLIVLTNNDKAEPESFVDSRNYPYLTAEGNFNVSQNNFKWVFQSTPDGFSCLFFSMKLFDLRFGETIIIYPNKDHSFFYEQLEKSPNNYSTFEDYLKSIKSNKRNSERLKQWSHNNAKRP